ncbi:MAG TPA: glycosyltransferase family 87 protein [Drouetiella sp.]
MQISSVEVANSRNRDATDFEGDSFAKLTPHSISDRFFRSHWQSFFLIAMVSWLLIGNAYRGANTGRVHEDFQTFYNAGYRLNHGQPLYDWKTWSNADDLHFARFSYDYTPTVGIIARPFAVFSMDTAYKLWFVSQVLFLFGAIALFAIFSDYALSGTVPITICLITGMHYWPTVCNFDVGQVNFLMLFLLCGLLVCQKRSQFTAFGVIVGLLACVKYWAIGLTCLLLLQRKWRASFAAICTFAGVTTLQFAFIGWSEVGNFSIVATKVVTQVTKALPSQSVFGFFRMLFSETAFSKPMLPLNDIAYWFACAIACASIAGISYFVIRNTPVSTKAVPLKYALTIQSILLLLPACHIVYFIFSLRVLWILLFIPARHSSRGAYITLGAASLYLVAMHWPFPDTGVWLLGFFYWSLALWLLSMCALLLADKPEPVQVTA